jgi:hypothetical protein
MCHNIAVQCLDVPWFAVTCCDMLWCADPCSKMMSVLVQGKGKQLLLTKGGPLSCPQPHCITQSVSCLCYAVLCCAPAGK